MNTELFHYEDDFLMLNCPALFSDDLSISDIVAEQETLI